MSEKEFEDLKTKITDYLRSEGRATLSMIIKAVAASTDDTLDAIKRLANDGVIRENETDLTYLRITGELSTFSLN